MGVNMIYEFNTHSIYLKEKYKKPTFSLMIDTLELVIDYLTRKVLNVQGFLPLIKAVKSKIILPEAPKGDYCIDYIDFSEINQFDVSSISKMIPKSKIYFENNEIVFDKEKGIIRLGLTDSRYDKYIKICDNVIIGYDGENIIKCIYIIPDKFI